MSTRQPVTAETVYDAVHKIARETLGIDELGMDEDLVRLGANSLIAAEIIGEIEIEFGVDVIGEFFDGPTVRQVGDTVIARRASAAS